MVAIQVCTVEMEIGETIASQASSASSWNSASDLAAADSNGLSDPMSRSTCCQTKANIPSGKLESKWRLSILSLMRQCWYVVFLINIIIALFWQLTIKIHGSRSRGAAVLEEGWKSHPKYSYMKHHPLAILKSPGCSIIIKSIRLTPSKHPHVFSLKRQQFTKGFQ